MRSPDASIAREHAMDRRIRAIARARRFSDTRVHNLLALPLEEKERFVQGHTRKVLMLSVVVLTVMLAFNFLPKFDHVQMPAPRFHAAGTVQGIALHSSFLNTQSTVVTTSGTFQVQGAVSAAQGDAARMRVSPSAAGDATALCIDSAIKSSCYPLL